MSRHDVILMDMQMHGIDGVQATRRIRSNGDAKSRIPIIALTADLVPEHHNAYLDAGANVVLGKPIEWLKLARELGRLCGDGETPDSQDNRDRMAAEPIDERPLLDGEVLNSLRAEIGAERVNVALGKFQADLAICRRDLIASLNVENRGQLQRTLHSLKSLCMQFGATRVGKMAAALEVDLEGDQVLQRLHEIINVMAILESELESKAHLQGKAAQ